MTTKKRISDTKKNAETQMNNQRAMIKRLCLSSSVIGLFSMTLLHAMPAFADCATPASPEGGLAYFTADDTYRYCDSTDTWVVIATSGGSSLWTDNTTHITRGNFHVLNTGETMTTAGFDGVADTYSLYHTDKSALRIGRAEWGSWNEAYIGNYSLAIGNHSTAAGEGSFAGGLQNEASGDGSLVMGTGSTAGPRGMTVGYQIDNQGWDSYAFGWQMDINAGAYGVFAVHTDGATDKPEMGTNSDGSVVFFMGAQEAVVMNTGNTLGLFGGNMVIDPADPATQLSARATLDIGASTDSIILPTGTDAQRPASPVGGMLRYNTTASTDKIEFYDAEGTAWVQLGSGGSSLWTDNTTHITRTNFHVLNAGLAAGSTTAGLDGDGMYSFYDPDKGALRGGEVAFGETGWEDANIGTDSFAWGRAPRASGLAAVAFGDRTRATGESSFAAGYDSYATDNQAIAMGDTARATAYGSIALGQEVQATGINTMVIGLADQTSVGDNQVSGVGSMGIFMDDVGTYNLSDTDMFAVVGGQIMIDEDATSAASRGCIRYNDTTDKLQYSHDCTTYADMGGASSLWTDNTTHISRAGVHVLNAAETSDSTDMSIAGGGAAGKRMFFDMTKGSIRGGELGAANDAWDNANISPNSFAWGLNAEASGDSILAIGSNVTASSGGMALGGDITASQYSIAIGGPIDSYGLGAVAIGNNLESGGNSSVAIGSYVYSTGGASIGMGLSIGSHATGSVALGQNLYVANTGAGSVALGQDTEVSGANSMALGLGAAATAPVVSGANSFGVFMGDQSGIDVAAASTMAILGGDFIVGSYQLDDTATGSQDSRMFFDRSKGAFRVGEVAGTQWDDASVGTHSVAMGLGTSASGAESFAVGLDSVANNSVSFAAGQLVTASGYNSIAHGQEATASGGNSVVFGLGDATGAYPIVSGASSFGVFMGDQSGVDLSQTNTMALMGGRLGIGTVTPSVELEVTGDIEYTGTITDVSDRRLKDNIRPLDEHGSMLDKLASVDTYSFTMKDDKAGRAEFGVMAQELEGIFPELVRTAQDEMGTKSVNYVGLIAPMIEATKELKAENDVLKSQMDDLSQQVALLNKVTAQNVNKASMSGYVMMLVGLALGFGVALILQRRTKQS